MSQREDSWVEREFFLPQASMLFRPPAGGTGPIGKDHLLYSVYPLR